MLIFISDIYIYMCEIDIKIKHYINNLYCCNINDTMLKAKIEIGTEIPFSTKK